MPSANDLYNQQMTLQTNLDNMTVADPDAINRDLMSKVDFFKPQYQELAGMEKAAQDYIPIAMQNYYQGGTQGPGALNQLQSIIGGVGQRYGTADVLSNIIGAQKGRIGDMSKNALGMYDQQRQQMQSKYNNSMQMYQIQRQAEEEQARRAWEAEQAQKNRDFQASQSAMTRGGSGGGGGGGGSSLSNLYNQSQGSPVYQTTPGAQIKGIKGALKNKFSTVLQNLKNKYQSPKSPGKKTSSNLSWIKNR